MSLQAGIFDVSAQEKFGEMLKLSALIDVALEKNPEVLAAKDKWESANELIEARRALPDPEISYSYFLENVETRVGPQRHVIGVRQKLPFYGKRDLKAEIALKEAETLKASYEATKQELIRQVKKSFYDLFYVSKLIDITHSEKEILKTFEEIAMTKYQTGTGTQQNILKVQVEISRLEERLLMLSNQKQTAEAMLSTLLNRPVDYPMGKPEEPRFRKFYYIQEELFRMGRKNRPELRGGLARIEKSNTALSLAKKDYFPDLTVGANYIEIGEGAMPVNDNGKDAFNVMFSINLPIWKKKLSSQVNSVSKMIKAEKNRYETILNRTLFEIKDNYFKIQTARETYYLYTNVLIPQAGQSLRSAEAGYITGKVSFLDVLDAERILLQIQFGLWRAYTDYLQRIADMERAVGLELHEYRPEDDIPARVLEEQ